MCVRGGARPGLVGAWICVTLAAGCSGDPAGPEDPAPVLSNFTYVVEALNLEECPPSNLANSSKIRWTVEFKDPDGDVAAPLSMLWSTSFNPSGTTRSALLILPSGAITGDDGFAGSISQSQCLRFVEQESVDITVSIFDAEGNHSDPRTLRIERPTGALAPPQGSTVTRTYPFVQQH